MALIPRNNPDLHILNNKIHDTLPRAYLGLSQIGEECHRKLQFDHHRAYEIHTSERMMRLFQTGHSQEAIMTAYLAKIGIEVTDQQSYIIGTAGHWKGHTDGVGYCNHRGTFLVEFKTHNDKSFKDLKKNGVKKSKPVHYDQMTAYAGYKKLSRSLYMAMNKNDSEYYLEWVDFDEERFKELKHKEFEVISAEALLPRVGTNSPTWFKCKLCNARNVCFGTVKPNVNCRTCKHVDVEDDGIWSCSKFKKKLTNGEQLLACDKHDYSTFILEI